MYSRQTFRPFRVSFAFRFVSTQQGCLFLWADSSIFFLQGVLGNLIFWADVSFVSRIFRVSFRFDTTGLCFILGGQLCLLSLRSSKATFSGGRRFVRFAYLSRFVSFRLYVASLRQDFSLGGQLSLLVLGPNESGRRFFLSLLLFRC